jgi:hypothetical protein
MDAALSWSRGETYMKRSSMMGPTIPMAAHDTAAGDLKLARDG